MDIKVDTIVKWYDEDKELEGCEDGQCYGFVTKLTDKEGNDNPPSWVEPDIYVQWFRFCAKHAQIDPDGTGPYASGYLRKIGQLD